MFLLAFRNLTRRPLRNALTLAGLAAAVATLACLLAFGQGYRRALTTEMERSGVQLMLVPLGCPYDAAARVLKGHELEFSLPAAALEAARRDPAVAVAAPLLMAAVPRPREGRTDVWVGLDETAMRLKPWWKAKSGTRWFPDGADGAKGNEQAQSVILGAEAAEVEMRAPGDRFFSPETGRAFRVAGVLERSGTGDDSLFFVPLRTAQAMFRQPGRLTAVAIRVHDPSLMNEATRRLQQVPGAQVVTLSEMMGTFLNLVGAVRALLIAIAVVAVAAGALGVFNTLLAAVLERTGEMATMRALGASRPQIFGLVALESLLLTLGGSALGLALAALAGRSLESAVKGFVPLAPVGSLLALTPPLALQCLLVGVGVGVLAGFYPAWRASRLHPAAALRLD